MASHYLEARALQATDSLSKDVARHLYVRQFCGPVVVVTDRPTITMPSVKRQWHKTERRAARERSSTLRSSRLTELSHMVSYMQCMRFVVTPQKEELEQGVVFLTPDELLSAPQPCRTLYVTCDVDESELLALHQTVDRNGLIVMYP